MFLERHDQELSMLMATAGWGCLLPVPEPPLRHHCHALPCTHPWISLCLTCTLKSWLGHAFLPPWLWIRSTHTCQSGPQTTSTASANINNSDNSWYLFKGFYAFPNLFPKILTTSRHSWHSAVWKAILYRLKQNTIMHLFFWGTNTLLYPSDMYHLSNISSCLTTRIWKEKLYEFTIWCIDVIFQPAWKHNWQLHKEQTRHSGIKMYKKYEINAGTCQ